MQAASVALLFIFLVDFFQSFHTWGPWTEGSLLNQCSRNFTGFSEVFTYSCVKLGILWKQSDTIQFITRTATLKIVLFNGLLSSSSQPSCTISGQSPSWSYFWAYIAKILPRCLLFPHLLTLYVLAIPPNLLIGPLILHFIYIFPPMLVSWFLLTIFLTARLHSKYLN